MKHSKIYQKALMLANEPVHCLTLEEARERVGVLSAALLYRRDGLESAAEAVAKLSEGGSIVLNIDKRDVMEIWPFTSRPQIEVLGSGSVRVTRPLDCVIKISTALLVVLIVAFCASMF